MFVRMLDVMWMDFGEWRVVVVCWLKIIIYFLATLDDFGDFGDLAFLTSLPLSSGSRASSAYDCQSISNLVLDLL